MKPLRSPAFWLLAALAVATWWLAGPGRPDAEPAAAAAATQPGYYVRDALLEQTDEAGRLELRLAAARAQQDPPSGEVDVETIRVDYFPADRAPWEIHADRGRLPREATHVHLAGDVTLEGTAEGERAAPVVRTDTLTLDVTRSVARTDDEVRIEFGPHAVTAQGLTADLEADRLELLADVDGSFTRAVPARRR